MRVGDYHLEAQACRRADEGAVPSPEENVLEDRDAGDAEAECRLELIDVYLMSGRMGSRCGGTVGWKGWRRGGEEGGRGEVCEPSVEEQRCWEGK